MRRPRLSGRPFLEIPGPPLVPERVTRAMSQSIIDHRGPKFAALVQECLAGLKGVFQTEKGQIVIYPGSGTGAWEACLVNTLSPGDRVLACVNGHFSTGFARTAAAYGLGGGRPGVPHGPRRAGGRSGSPRTWPTSSGPCSSCTTRPPRG